MCLKCVQKFPKSINNVSKICSIFVHSLDTYRFYLSLRVQYIFQMMCPKCVQNVSKHMDTFYTPFGHFQGGFPYPEKCLKSVQNMTLVWTHF